MGILWVTTSSRGGTLLPQKVSTDSDSSVREWVFLRWNPQLPWVHPVTPLSCAEDSTSQSFSLSCISYFIQPPFPRCSQSLVGGWGKGVSDNHVLLGLSIKCLFLRTLTSYGSLHQLLPTASFDEKQRETNKQNAQHQNLLGERWFNSSEDPGPIPSSPAVSHKHLVCKFSRSKLSSGFQGYQACKWCADIRVAKLINAK